MPTWPVSVPTSCNLETLSEKDMDVAARWQPDVGTDFVRQRTSMTITDVSYEKLMTITQYEALMSFFRVTCRNGTLKFDTTHPRKGTSIKCQWKGPPDMHSAASTDFVNVTIAYTILPYVAT